MENLTEVLIWSSYPVDTAVRKNFTRPSITDSCHISANACLFCISLMYDHNIAKQVHAKKPLLTIRGIHSVTSVQRRSQDSN